MDKVKMGIIGHGCRGWGLLEILLSLDDVDVIAIPDYLYEEIDRLAEEFLDWKAPEDDWDYWCDLNGRKFPMTGAKGFVKWLNNFYCHGEEKAIIVEKNVVYTPNYKMVEF